MRPAAPQATPVATFSGWETATTGVPDAYFQVPLTVYADAVPVEYVRLLPDSQVTFCVLRSDIESSMQLCTSEVLSRTSWSACCWHRPCG